MTTTFTSDQQALQHTYDIYMIKNVMGRHAWYHALGKHREELDTIWSKRDDISWGNGAGFWIGRDVLYNYYADSKDVQDLATLKLKAKKDPSIEVKPENYNLGVLLMHTLTTPLVEVADDGETAQAMWYSLGQVTNAGADGSATGMWMQERYAVDFIKEDGQWKIWHFFVGTDMSVPAGEAFTGEQRPMGGSEEDQKAMAEIMNALPKPTLPIKQLYTSYFGWCNYPPFPKPYKTFSETYSYGPEPYVK